MCVHGTAVADATAGAAATAATAIADNTPTLTSRLRPLTYLLTRGLTQQPKLAYRREVAPRCELPAGDLHYPWAFREGFPVVRTNTGA